jgi:hypothetical protein
MFIILWNGGSTMYCKYNTNFSDNEFLFQYDVSFCSTHTLTEIFCVMSHQHAS